MFTMPPKAEWPPLQDLEDKLIKARCRLMTLEPFYGHISMRMTWRHSPFDWKNQEESKTMGVRVLLGGKIECLWYPGFVHSQSLQQLYGVIYHEIDHLIRVHCIRQGTSREHEPWNISADMTINGRSSKPKIGYVNPTTGKRVLPLDGNIVWVPEDWEDGLSAEAYYNLLVKNAVRIPCPACQAAGKTAGDGDGQDQGQGQSQGQSQGKGKSKGKGKANKGPASGAGSGMSSGPARCPVCGGKQGGTESHYDYGGVSGRAMDDHSTWQYSEVSQDEARQIVRDLVNEATAKCQGVSPGHLTEAIKALQRPVIRWREHLKQYFGRYVGNSRPTYSRRNRRHDQFGIKGVTRHAASSVRVIVDTSGSMTHKELEHAFTEIESMSSHVETKVLLWDDGFQGFQKYRRGDWKKWQLRGRGGTNMAAPIKWLADNRQLGDCQVLITDGYCNWAEKQPWFPELGMITVITHADPAPPSWGHVVRLDVN